MIIHLLLDLSFVCLVLLDEKVFLLVLLFGLIVELAESIDLFELLLAELAQFVTVVFSAGDLLLQFVDHLLLRLKLDLEVLNHHA